ncbi:hypothetical protein ACFQ0R_01645 [Psychroflexus salinarum]|uniref:GIY-YIG domain-containing protein n=1 Tax=Psychroflexus salinarum TaxID=546024 RepID=A0ABW3GLJ2_9FLAO
MKEHYVYIHLNPNSNEIFYVGKGKGNRKSSKTSRNEKWDKYVAKLGGQFKILIIKENLSEKEAIELERKIISKIDWHYDDLTTNIADSFSDLEDSHTIEIVFENLKQSTQSKKHTPKAKFQNLSDLEIISTLLYFPNELEIKKISTEFEKVCEYFQDNWGELEEIDEDIFLNIEDVVDSIEDLFTEYKSSDKKNIQEFIIDLDREKVEIEIIQEDKPKGKQKKFLTDLAEWVDNVTGK